MKIQCRVLDARVLTPNIANMCPVYLPYGCDILTAVLVCLQEECKKRKGFLGRSRSRERHRIVATFNSHHKCPSEHSGCVYF